MADVRRAKRAIRRRVEPLIPTPRGEWDRAFREEILASHPGFVEAVLADARVAVRMRGDRWTIDGPVTNWFHVVRLAVVGDSFLGQICYRAKASLQARRVPVLPHLFHRLAIVTGQICIGDPVVVDAGVYIPHGQVVADAMTKVGAGATLSPFTTLGRIGAKRGGPTIGALAFISTGAKVVGPVTVGARARVGANAVVLGDVPPDAAAVGVPARIVDASEVPADEAMDGTTGQP